MPSDDSVVFHDVSFRFESASELLFGGLSVHLSRGFTGVVGANGAGKTTFLRLASGELDASQGSVQAPRDVVYCPQRTDDPPVDLAALLEASDSDAHALRGRLGVDPSFGLRWSSLSHGERKRAQIAAALWRDPSLLAIDEPTNHIDAQARLLLARALERYRGVALLVSHDRELLDALCSHCLWIEPPRVSLIPGGYTQSSAHREADRERASHLREYARRDRDRLKRETVKRREQASRSHRDRSKRGLAPKDHDARAKKNLARVTGKDGQAGRLLRQLEGRSRRAESRLDAARVEKTHELGIWLPGSRSRRSTLFELEPGSLALGGDRHVRFPKLTMRPDERIAITGPNGGGKTTLVRRILERVGVPERNLTVIPQEIDSREGAEILDDARSLPAEELGRVMNVVSRLGSRPARLLETTNPSPGELRKLLLALGMVRTPHLIVMDEPTNHLDLPSIECLEAALADCPCGLLLVSHDERFLSRLARTRWEIANGALEISYLE